MIGYLIYKFIQTLSIILPLDFSYKIAESVALIYYILARNARSDIISNLKFAFPYKDKLELEKISIKIFRNFAKGLVDFLRFSKIDYKFIEKNVKIHNLDYIKNSLEKSGVIGLTAHVGNWELGGIILAMFGLPVNAVAMPHSRQKVERFFINQRGKKGINVISVGKAYKQCYKKLLSKEFLALLADRRYVKAGIEVEFFGRKVLVPKGPAMLSFKTNSPIISGYMIRQNNHFELFFEKPIFPTQVQGKNLQEKIKNMAQIYTNIMEKYIIKYPDQWLLFYEIFNENLDEI